MPLNWNGIDKKGANKLIQDQSGLGDCIATVDLATSVINIDALLRKPR